MQAGQILIDSPQVVVGISDERECASLAHSIHRAMSPLALEDLYHKLIKRHQVVSFPLPCF